MTLTLAATVRHEVTVPCTGTLHLSQAAGAPVAAHVWSLTVRWTTATDLRITPHGRTHGHPIAQPLSSRGARTLADLEATNPGLTAQLAAAVPTAPTAPWS